MNTFKLIALATIAMLFASCKASQPTGPPSGATPSLYEVAQILNSTDSMFLAYSTLNNGNAHQAIMQTTTWVQSQPNVQSATALDSTYITIVLKSGLQTTFFFDAVDDSGMSIFRGGGPGKNEPHLSVSGTQATNAIPNKNVLIYCAGFSEFYKNNAMGINPIHIPVDILTNSGAGLNVTLLEDSECTYQIVNNFQNYGLVIIDTHGFPDAFMTGTKINIDNTIVTDDLFRASIVAQGGQDMLNKLLSGQLSFSLSITGKILTPYWKFTNKTGIVSLSLFLTSKFIDALPPMTGTVIFGNFCYSGWGASLASLGSNLNTVNGIEASFMNKNPISYYCFAFADGSSDPVSNAFATIMEDTLCNALAVDLDSTKIANLEPDHQTEYFDTSVHVGNLDFKHFGADDYSYPQPCGDTIADSRDGQKYATVCIGNQRWMAQNLNYQVSTIDSIGCLCYNNDPANCSVYGQLYDDTTLMNGASHTNANPSGVRGLCPLGWHIPSAAEFDQLLASLGGAANAGGALKSTSLWARGAGTNSSGFNALPAGEGVPNLGPGAAFFDITTYTEFRTTYFDSANGTTVTYQVTAGNTVSNTSILGNTPDAVSCRCVKDQ